MPIIRVLLEGDGAFKDLQGREKDVIHLTGDFTVAALAKGMISGKPSVMIRIDLPDGRVVLQETSYALWMTASAALRGKFGEPA